MAYSEEVIKALMDIMDNLEDPELLEFATQLSSKRCDQIVRTYRSLSK